MNVGIPTVRSMGLCNGPWSRRRRFIPPYRFFIAVSVKSGEWMVRHLDTKEITQGCPTFRRVEYKKLFFWHHLSYCGMVPNVALHATHSFFLVPSFIDGTAH